MKKIYSLLIVLLFVGSTFAQQKEAEIPKTATAPEIDGFLDDIWEELFEGGEAIDVNFQAEVPTIGDSKWWALYDDDNIYIMVYADDDNHYPGWKNPSGNEYEHDKCEVYFDVNVDALVDGVGASTDASGHYQQAAGFISETSYDTPITKSPSSVGHKAPEGTYCFTLDGEGYWYEHAIPWANMPDKDGNATNPTSIGTKKLGFDVTIIDQDEGVTTARARANWNNAGAVDEAWNNLDDAGLITLKQVSAKNYKNRTMSVYPNPAVDNVTINADFNKVVISNILGQEVKSIAASSKVINISDLSKGVYVIKAYKNNAYVGTAKVTKN